MAAETNLTIPTALSGLSFLCMPRQQSLTSVFLAFVKLRRRKRLETDVFAPSRGEPASGEIDSAVWHPLW
jgi:hypothetical protein